MYYDVPPGTELVSNLYPTEPPQTEPPQTKPPQIETMETIQFPMTISSRKVRFIFNVEKVNINEIGKETFKFDLIPAND